MTSRGARSADRRSRAREDGAIAILTALTLTIVIGFTIAAVVIGRMVEARRALQRAADAAALAGAFSLEQHGQPFRLAPALAFAGANTSLPLPAAGFRVISRPAEHRAIVELTLTGTFDSLQSWFPGGTRPLTATSYAQVNEMVFGDTWPAVLLVLDASESMRQPILGSQATAGFTVLQQLVTSYVGDTLPARNGVVIFNDQVLPGPVGPPAGEARNADAILEALGRAVPQGVTNTAAALTTAAQLLQPLAQRGRNVIMITDGEPTRADGCADHTQCCFTAARARAEAVRHDANAALFNVEIARESYYQAATDFLRGAAGPPGSAGNDPGMYFQVQSVMGIQMFINSLSRSICAFGPLTPGSGAAADPALDAVRPRPLNPDLVQPRQRVFAFLREPGGQETAIPLVADRDAASGDTGFQYVVQTDGPAGTQGPYVILTRRSCNALGADAGRRLVVRWDDAQLVAAP